LIMISHEQDIFLKLEPREFDMLVSDVGPEDLQLQGDDEVPGETY